MAANKNVDTYYIATYNAIAHYKTNGQITDRIKCGSKNIHT